MSTPRLGSLVRVATAFVVAISLAGCGNNDKAKPLTVDQAGHNLEVQVYKLIFALTTSGVQVTDGLYDKYVPCGGNKVKLTYAVSGKATAAKVASTSSNLSKASGKTAAKPSEIIDALVDFLPEIGTFSVTKSPGDATAQLVNATTHTRMTLHSPGPNRVAIAGETDCLLRGVDTHGH